jgi:hypothetical protein
MRLFLFGPVVFWARLSQGSHNHQFIVPVEQVPVADLPASGNPMLQPPGVRHGCAQTAASCKQPACLALTLDIESNKPTKKLRSPGALSL